MSSVEDDVSEVFGRLVKVFVRWIVVEGAPHHAGCFRGLIDMDVECFSVCFVPVVALWAHWWFCHQCFRCYGLKSDCFVV